MNRMLKVVLVVGMLLLAMAAPALAAPVAANGATTCSAGVTIMTTSTGTVRNTGQVTHYQDSGVAGMYTAGFLAGYTFSGAQDIMVNNVTNQSQLNGSYTATGPDGTFVVHYTGTVNLNTGASTGHFAVQDGTGMFAGFHWAGGITAQLISLTPPTFVATNSGMCQMTQ
jgi:hypothetical protein